MGCGDADMLEMVVRVMLRGGGDNGEIVDKESSHTPIYTQNTSILIKLKYK